MPTIQDTSKENLSESVDKTLFMGSGETINTGARPRTKAPTANRRNATLPPSQSGGEGVLSHADKRKSKMVGFPLEQKARESCVGESRTIPETPTKTAEGVSVPVKATEPCTGQPVKEPKFPVGPHKVQPGYMPIDIRFKTACPKEYSKILKTGEGLKDDIESFQKELERMRAKREYAEKQRSRIYKMPRLLPRPCLPTLPILKPIPKTHSQYKYGMGYRRPYRPEPESECSSKSQDDTIPKKSEINKIRGKSLSPSNSPMRKKSPPASSFSSSIMEKNPPPRRPISKEKKKVPPPPHLLGLSKEKNKTYPALGQMTLDFSKIEQPKIFSKWDILTTPKAINEYYSKVTNWYPPPPLRTKYSINEMRRAKLSVPSHRSSSSSSSSSGGSGVKKLTLSKLREFNTLTDNKKFSLCEKYFKEEKLNFKFKLSYGNRSSKEKSRYSSRKSSPQSPDSNATKGDKSPHAKPQGDKSHHGAHQETKSKDNSSQGEFSTESSIPRGYPHSQCISPPDSYPSSSESTSEPKSGKLGLPATDAEVKSITSRSKSIRNARLSFVMKPGISCYKIPLTDSYQYFPTISIIPKSKLKQKKKDALSQIPLLSPEKSAIPLPQLLKESGIKVASDANTTLSPKESKYTEQRTGHEYNETEENEQRDGITEPGIIRNDGDDKPRGFLLKAEMSEKERRGLTKILTEQSDDQTTHVADKVKPVFAADLGLHLSEEQISAALEEIKSYADVEKLPVEAVLMLAELEKLKEYVLQYRSAPVPVQQSKRSKSDTDIVAPKLFHHSQSYAHARKRKACSDGKGTVLSKGKGTEINLPVTTAIKSKELEILENVTGNQVDAEGYADKELSNANSKSSVKSASEKLAQDCDTNVTLQRRNFAAKTDPLPKSKTSSSRLKDKTPKSSAVSTKPTNNSGGKKTKKTVPTNKTKLIQRLRPGRNKTNVEFSRQVKQDLPTTACRRAEFRDARSASKEAHLALSSSRQKMHLKNSEVTQFSGSNLPALSPKKTTLPKATSTGLKTGSNHKLNSKGTCRRPSVSRDRFSYGPTLTHPPRRWAFRKGITFPPYDIAYHGFMSNSVVSRPGQNSKYISASSFPKGSLPSQSTKPHREKSSRQKSPSKVKGCHPLESQYVSDGLGTQNVGHGSGNVGHSSVLPDIFHSSGSQGGCRRKQATRITNTTPKLRVQKEDKGEAKTSLRDNNRRK